MGKLIDKYGLLAAKITVFIIVPTICWMLFLWGGCRVLNA